MLKRLTRKLLFCVRWLPTSRWLCLQLRPKGSGYQLSGRVQYWFMDVVDSASVYIYKWDGSSWVFHGVTLRGLVRRVYLRRGWTWPVHGYRGRLLHGEGHALLLESLLRNCQRIGCHRSLGSKSIRVHVYLHYGLTLHTPLFP
jgi:hypothetical protein